MTRRCQLIALLAFALSLLWWVSSRPPQVDAEAARPRVNVNVRAFLEANCYACHSGATRQGNLDLAALDAELPPIDLADAEKFARWVQVHDRVRDGEMPPKGMPQPSGAERAAFLQTLAAPLVKADAARVQREGRATWRRMNRYEYENTLRDLLGAPWLQIKDLLPEDGEAHRFNKVGEALDVSYVQMSRYLAAADYALREVMALATARPAATTKRYYAREQNAFARRVIYTQFNRHPERATFPMLDHAADVPALEARAPMTVGAQDPAVREREAMGVTASTYNPLEIKFDNFRAPAAGRYKLRINAYSFWAGPGNLERWWSPSRYDLSIGRTREPVTIYAETAGRQLRKLGGFDISPEPGVSELDVYLLKGETIRPDAVRLFRSRPPGTTWRNPLAQKDGQPGVAFRWLEVEGPLLDEWPSRGHRLLFGDLPIKGAGKSDAEIVPRDVRADAERLLRGFLGRAYRRPVPEEDVRQFLRLAQTARAGGLGFAEAMLTAYAAALCAPAFVTLAEQPGPLDNYALAARLSYFLWNSEPDAQLRQLAEQGALRQPGVLRGQAERLLADVRAQRFINAFLDYWLDLRKLNNTSPDATLYADYYLDDLLVESADEETRRFFAELLRDDLPARNLVASDFVMINERLAAHYGLPEVQGVDVRRVQLPPDSVRGGLLTQASVLKVTANGTTTSPVLRGVWITERILGKHVPPPPSAVPAVEPDTRGATTIRAQLDKHRTEASCNACHAQIDPPGFALEAFDVMGGLRDRYRALGEGARVPGHGKNGQPFEFHHAQLADASGTLADGRRFEDVRQLKRLLLQDERQIARNLVAQLVVFATGAPVRFGDRAEVEAMLDRAAAKGYGVQSLVHELIASQLFQHK